VEEAVEFAISNPAASFGVHLNFSEGRCIGSTKDAAGLIAGGQFSGRPPRSRVHPRENQIVFDEWRAQIDRLLELGLQPSHIDSHHHVHTIPKYFPVLKRIQKAYGIPRIRISKNIYATPPSLLGRLSKVFWNSALRLVPPFTRTTDFFTSVDDYHTIDPSRLRDGTYELMCHPGHPDYEDETSKLAAYELLAGHEALISYHSL
jgi:predicted glycoside hydrolase/deacetylase ChbG (UPF0249 family)